MIKQYLSNINENTYFAKKFGTKRGMSLLLVATTSSPTASMTMLVLTTRRSSGLDSRCGSVPTGDAVSLGHSQCRLYHRV